MVIKRKLENVASVFLVVRRLVLLLHRAVYARADIYLMDDVLSAVDQHVGRHIIDNVLGPKGLLSGKTRILATNAIPVLMEAHFIVLLRDGRIIERGTYEQATAMKGEIAHLIKTASNDETEEAEEAVATPSTESETIYESESPEDDVDEIEEVEESIDHLAPIKPAGTATKRKGSELTLRRASTASFRGPRGKVSDEEDNKAVLKTKQSKETSEQGQVKRDIYIEYAKASNLGAVLIYLVMLVGAQTAQIGESNFRSSTLHRSDKVCSSCLPGDAR